jgi:hypothetical protein
MHRDALYGVQMWGERAQVLQRDEIDASVLGDLPHVELVVLDDLHQVAPGATPRAGLRVASRRHVPSIFANFLPNLAGVN